MWRVTANMLPIGFGPQTRHCGHTFRVLNSYFLGWSMVESRRKDKGKRERERKINHVLDNFVFRHFLKRDQKEILFRSKNFSKKKFSLSFESSQFEVSMYVDSGQSIKLIKAKKVFMPFVMDIDSSDRDDSGFCEYSRRFKLLQVLLGSKY